MTSLIRACSRVTPAKAGGQRYTGLPAEVILGYTDRQLKALLRGRHVVRGDMTFRFDGANTSEAGENHHRTILNTPPDNKPSLDAPLS